MIQALAVAALIVAIAVLVVAMAFALWVMAIAARVFTVALGQAMELGIVHARTKEAKKMLRREDDLVEDDETLHEAHLTLAQDIDDKTLRDAVIQADRAGRAGKRVPEYNAEDNAKAGQDYEAAGTSVNGR